MEQKKMLPPRRARIIQCKYIENSELIQCTLFFLDNSIDQMYVWPVSDFLSAVNIKQKVPANLLHKFCQDIVNKEINFVIDEEPPLPKPEITKEQMRNLKENMICQFDIFKESVSEHRYEQH
jgi:hypothetical protein